MSALLSQKLVMMTPLVAIAALIYAWVKARWIEQHEMGIDKIRDFGDQNSFIYDVRYLFPSNQVDRSI